MSNLTHGMNLEEVEELGHALKERAKAISAIAGQIDRRVHSTTWAGSDAEKFRGSWWPTHKAKLYATAKELDGLGQSALNNATEQRSASDEKATAAPAGAPPSALRLPDYLNVDSYASPSPQGSTHGGTLDYEQLARILDSAQDFKFIKDVYGLTTGELDEAVRLMKDGGFVSSKYVPVVGALIGLAMDGSEVATNHHLYGGGDSRTMRSEVDAGVGLFLTPVPGGGVAWTCGSRIGEAIGNTAPVQAWAGTVYDSARDAMAGGDYNALTLEHKVRVDSAMVERYSGWSGLGHFIWDAAG